MSDSQQTSDNSELCYAMRRRDIEKVRWLLQNSNINVNTPNLNGNTPLHLAVFCFNDLDIITMLLDKGADIHVMNEHNETPLSIAFDINKMEVAALLIRKGALVAEDWYSVLLKAIHKNNSIIVESINYWMQSNPSVDFRTSLNTAISQGNSKIIEYILPHCQFLEPSDKYIPKKIVVNSGSCYKDCVDLLFKWNFTISPDSHQDKDFIFAAVEKGCLLIVLQLLGLGIDVNMVNPMTRLDLLTVACLNKHHEIVKNLLKHGSNVNVEIPARDWKLIKPWYFYSNLKSYNDLFPAGHQNILDDITCLHIAALNSDSKTMKVLLKYNSTIDHEMAFNLTCIAAHHGCEDIVRIFLDRCVNVTDTDSKGRSLLHYCVHWTSNSGNNDSRYNIAKLILEKAANINIQNPGNTFVSKSIQERDCKIFLPFSDSRADIAGFTLVDDISLHNAIVSKFDAKFLGLLLHYKFPVNAKSSFGWTPLHVACRTKRKYQLENIEVLLHHDADVNCTSDNLMTPLHFVCRYHNLEAAVLLLKNGANPNATDDAGQTALHMVCESGFTRTYADKNAYEQQQDRIERIIKLLLQHNANIDAVNLQKRTPFTTAYLYRNKAAINCLLENHAKNDYIYSGNSALFSFAIRERCVRMIKNLIKNGADINNLDEKNRTPLQYAIQILYVNSSFCQEMVKLLKTQVVKLKVAGLYVINNNLNLFYNSNSNNFTIDIQQLEVKCQQEIEKMKIKCIGNDEITFYHLLKKNITILSRLDGIEGIQEALKLGVYDEEFPLYIDIVRSKVRKAKIRHHLMHFAGEYFHVNVCHYLPCECIELILNYLKIEELERFIEATKSPKN